MDEQCDSSNLRLYEKFVESDYHVICENLYRNDFKLDTTILYASFGGLITLFLFFSNPFNYVEFLLMVIIDFCYICCIVAVVLIFIENKKYILEMKKQQLDMVCTGEGINREPFLKIEKNFKKLDKTARYMFILGIIITIVLHGVISHRLLKQNEMIINNTLFIINK